MKCKPNWKIKSSALRVFLLRLVLKPRGLLYRDSKSWEKRLKDLFDLIEEVQKCQRIWMYLEPIFASDDIGKTLPEELAMFKVVDTLWRTTMEYCVE